VTAWIRGLSDRGELILVNAICHGWGIVGALIWLVIRPRTMALGTLRALELIALELFSATAAVAVLHVRGWRIRRLGLTPTLSYTLAGVALYLGFMVAWGMVRRALYTIPLFAEMFNATPGMTHTAPWQLLMLVAIVNPLYEEAFVAAYNIEALHHRGPELAIGISIAIRVAYHLYQGPSANFSIGLFGVVCGAVYWRWRTAWPLVVMHAIADAFAFAR
jgi:uncharacterized protein